MQHNEFKEVSVRQISNVPFFVSTCFLHFFCVFIRTSQKKVHAQVVVHTLK